MAAACANILSAAVWFIGYRSQNKQAVDTIAILKSVRDIIAELKEVDAHQLFLFYGQKRLALLDAFNSETFGAMAKEIFLVSCSFADEHEFYREKSGSFVMKHLLARLGHMQTPREWSEDVAALRPLFQAYASRFRVVMLGFTEVGESITTPGLEEIVSNSNSAILCNYILCHVLSSSRSNRYEELARWVKNADPKRSF